MNVSSFAETALAIPDTETVEGSKNTSQSHVPRDYLFIQKRERWASHWRTQMIQEGPLIDLEEESEEEEETPPAEEEEAPPAEEEEEEVDAVQDNEDEDVMKASSLRASAILVKEE